MRALALSCVVAMMGCAEQADQAQIALGAGTYATHCAACHGAKLEGLPNWRQKLPNGRWPAPPHDDSGQTWHHSDRWLFDVVEEGMVPPNLPRGYQNDMPAFVDKLSNAEMRAVPAYIKSGWSEETLRNGTKYCESALPGPDELTRLEAVS